MDINVGLVDRALRVTLGGALIAMTSLGPQTPWGFLGIIPVFTGFMGFCPLYRAFHISSHHPRGPFSHA